jgi:pilus assembly protein Flp/PilA
MPTHISRAIQDDSGATAIEYSLIAGSIALIIITAVMVAGGDLAIWFQGVADAL